jgi:hypothetical protein
LENLHPRGKVEMEIAILSAAIEVLRIEVIDWKTGAPTILAVSTG